MLCALGTDVIQERPHVAVADLYNLAGWVCFDTGRAFCSIALAMHLAWKTGNTTSPTGSQRC